MIGNIASLQGDAEKLSVQQLQQSMRDGILPAYIGMPILQQKVQEQKQAQAAAQTQQGAPQPIAKQIEGEAQGLIRPSMQMVQAPQGVGSLPSNLPEEYARGGITAFAGDDGSPEAPQQNYSMPDFSALKRPETPAAEYQKQMQEALGENAGLPAIKEKLAKMEEEGASAKERAPWMALMQAGLATMAGTSPFAGVNIGQGGVAGLKAYSEAQDKFDKDEEKRLDMQNQLANAQRAEQVATWKYGADSNKADVAENKAIGLAEAKAKIDAQQNKNKDALDLYKARLGIPEAQAKTALYTAQTQAAQHPSAGNLSDYEGAKKVAMDNPTAPQYAKYFKTDPSSGKPVWDELSFRSDYSKKEVIDKTPIADLYKIISESQDPHMADLATKKLNNVLGDNNASPNPNVIKYDSKGNRI